MKLPIRSLLCALVAFALALAHALAFAQAYPTKPVKLVVGFPAGGPADIFGRTFAHALGAQLGQQIVVENKSGVGGVLGIDSVAKAQPDGYTLGFNNQGSVAMAPYSLSSMPYDPKRDLALITTVVKVPEVIVLHPSVPVSTLAELIAYAKKNPGKINYGSAGAGGITHLAGELLRAEARIDIVHVPYKGAAPAVNDLLGGQVQMGIFDVPIVLPHIKSGRLKALAVTTAQRVPTLPDVPTTGELGYPKVISDNWYGLVAPAGTPAEVLKRIHIAAVGALRTGALEEQFAKVGGMAAPATPQQYAAFLAAEQAKWGRIIKAIGFKEQP